jgi:hypothetical protein
VPTRNIRGGNNKLNDSYEKILVTGLKKTDRNTREEK